MGNIIRYPTKIILFITKLVLKVKIEFYIIIFELSVVIDVP